MLSQWLQGSVQTTSGVASHAAVVRSSQVCCAVLLLSQCSGSWTLSQGYYVCAARWKLCCVARHLLLLYVVLSTSMRAFVRHIDSPRVLSNNCQPKAVQRFGIAIFVHAQSSTCLPIGVLVWMKDFVRTKIAWYLGYLRSCLNCKIEQHSGTRTTALCRCQAPGRPIHENTTFDAQLPLCLLKCRVRVRVRS